MWSPLCLTSFLSLLLLGLAPSFAVLPPVINILVLGMTGHGKSETMNILYGEPVFPTSDSLCSSTQAATKKCKDVPAQGSGATKYCFVDSPGFFDTDRNHTEVIKELSNVAFLCPLGFHIIIFQLRPDRFTEQEKQTVAALEAVTGSLEAMLHTILTLRDGEKWSAERFLMEVDAGRAPEQLRRLVKQADRRVVAIDNSSPEARSASAEALYAKIHERVKARGGEPYTNQHFEDARRRLDEIVRTFDPKAKADHDWEEKLKEKIKEMEDQAAIKSQRAQADQELILQGRQHAHEKALKELDVRIEEARLKNQRALAERPGSSGFAEVASGVASILGGIGAIFSIFR